MKKIQIKDKLSLNKETIANLNTAELDTIKGGRMPYSEEDKRKCFSSSSSIQ